MEPTLTHLGEHAFNAQSCKSVANVISYLRDGFSEASLSTTYIYIILTISNIEAAKTTGVYLSTIYRIMSEKRKIDSGECSKYSSSRKHKYS